jgi:hypothetical protein
MAEPKLIGELLEEAGFNPIPKGKRPPDEQTTCRWCGKSFLAKAQWDAFHSKWVRIVTVHCECAEEMDSRMRQGLPLFKTGDEHEEEKKFLTRFDCYDQCMVPEELRLIDHLWAQAQRKRKIHLVIAGPEGSAKSRTLYALCQQIFQDTRKRPATYAFEELVLDPDRQRLQRIQRDAWVLFDNLGLVDASPTIKGLIDAALKYRFNRDKPTFLSCDDDRFADKEWNRFSDTALIVFVKFPNG